MSYKMQQGPDEANQQWKHGKTIHHSKIERLPGGPCPTCGGSGKVPDPIKIGAYFKAERLARVLTLREVARRMDVTPAYVSDLEHGRRGWRARIQKFYIKALR